MDVWLSNQKLTLLIIDNYGMVLKESSPFTLNERCLLTSCYVVIINQDK